jgi:mono/diheme cytochrome c family protein
MREKKSAGVFIAIAVLGLAGGIGARARSARQEPADAAISDEERVRLLSQGKEVFVEKCAKCHNESGDKPLSSGPPLNERGLASSAIARAVSGRLKDRTDEERRAVTLYISSLMKAKASEKSAPKWQIPRGRS